MNKKLHHAFFIKLIFLAIINFNNIYFAQDITQNLSHIANKVTPCPVSHTGPATGQVSLSLGIQKVQIGVINNVTTSQPPATAYNYYSSPIADVGIGNTSILTVTYYTSLFGGTSGQIGVWVDWNEDGDFLDTNEFIKVQPTTSVSGSIYTFNIMPPVGTAPGKKRLRIRTESTTRPTLTAINSCGALVYGETEDYDLIVTDVPENITFYDYNSPSQLSFNNSRSNIPKPIFRISHETVTATKYEVEINTDPSFVAAPVTTYIHTAALPVNTPKDVSLASATLSLNNGTTYYVRARAYSSLNFFGLWSQSRYSFTYNTSYPIPNWFQTTQAQFQSNSLSNTTADTNGDVVPSGIGTPKTITSTPIYLPSVLNKTNFETLEWSQVLGVGGTVKFKIQQAPLASNTWTDAVGYDNITMTGNGLKVYDISKLDMTGFGQIRLIAELTGAGIKLNDWAVTYPVDCNITWAGTTSTDWTAASNWNPANVPTIKNCINIPSVTKKPIIPINTTAQGRTLTLAPNANLTVSTGATLRILNSITNNGTDANFILENNASLVQEHNVTNAFKFNYKRITSAAWADDYIYLSSPIIDGKPNAMSAEIPTKNYARYYTWQPDSPVGKWASAVATNNMTPGVGYIAKVPTSWAANTTYKMNFKGIPNNGDINVIFKGGNAVDNPATANLNESLLDKWNLIGNPYPSAVDASLFLNNTNNKNLIKDPANPTATTNGDGALYFWNHKNGTGAVTNPFYNNGFPYASNPNNHYIVKNFTGTVPNETTITGVPAGSWNGMIPAGQSFFLRARPNINGNIIFTNSMRVDGNNSNYYKNNVSENRFWLEITRKEDSNSAQTLIGYIDNATNQLDYMYDGISMDNDLDVYSIVEDNLLLIQGRALPFDPKDIIPLGYKAPSSGAYRIGLYTTEGLFAPYGDQKIFLRDKTDNTIHDIIEKPYEFVTAEGRFNNRFEIVYEKTILATNESTNHNVNLVYDWTQHNWLITSNKSKLSNIEIYDVSGKLIWTKKDLNSHDYRLPFSTITQKLAIIKIQTIDGNLITKKIINP